MTISQSLLRFRPIHQSIWAVWTFVCQCARWEGASPRSTEQGRSDETEPTNIRSRCPPISLAFIRRPRASLRAAILASGRQAVCFVGYRDVVTDEMQEGQSKVVRAALSRANCFPCDFSALQVIKKLAERVGFEFTRKRSFNNIERTAGTVEQWKTIVSSANGSQTDHGSVSPQKEVGREHCCSTL